MRWGILGAARINRALVPAIQASARHELVAIASRSADKAREAARQWRVPRAHGSYEALLADPDLDAVYLPLPNTLHAEWTVRAARAGKHVLCEKPLALSVGELDRIAEAANESGVVVAEAFMYRHHPQTLRAVELIRSGRIGRLLLVRGAFSFPLGREGDIRLDPALGGGGLWDVGCYPVGYARLAIGEEPKEAFGWQSLGPTGVDESFAGLLRFPGGAVAQIDSGLRAPLRTWVEIVGSEGTLFVERAFKPEPGAALRLSSGGQTESIPIPDQALYAGELDDLADAVRLGRPQRVSLADSRGNCAALVALRRSASEGRPVPVERA